MSNLFLKVETAVITCVGTRLFQTLMTLTVKLYLAICAKFHWVAPGGAINVVM